ncbi:MAG: hypothetical protein ACAI34_22485 [Verrucomicrobium sp.]|nr:hypothetical protein [Verrucomicrobium sp.]
MPHPAVYLLVQTPLAAVGLGVESLPKELSLPTLIVCGLVTAWAIVCWARLLGSAVQLQRAAAADEEFLKAHQESSHSLEVYQDELVFANSPKHAVYVVSSRELAFHLMGADTLDKNFAMRLRAAGRITPSQMDSVRKVQERTAASMGRDLGSNLGGAGVNALPYVGLLGTLAGVLLTGTAVPGTMLLVGAVLPMGLAVLLFIPLMIWHNALVERVWRAREEVGDFSVELAAQFDRAFVDHRKPLESLPSLDSMVGTDGPTFSLPPSDTTRAMPVIGR